MYRKQISLKSVQNNQDKGQPRSVMDVLDLLTDQHSQRAEQQLISTLSRHICVELIKIITWKIK